jgi:hypothetical protein
MPRHPAAFKQSDVVRAVKSAEAAGIKVESVEIVTQDGTTIRVLGKRDAAADAAKAQPENLRDLV